MGYPIKVKKVGEYVVGQLTVFARRYGYKPKPCHPPDWVTFDTVDLSKKWIMDKEMTNDSPPLD